MGSGTACETTLGKHSLFANHSVSDSCSKSMCSLVLALPTGSVGLQCWKYLIIALQYVIMAA